MNSQQPKTLGRFRLVAGICLMILALCASAVHVNAQEDSPGDANDPVLISEPDSSRARTNLSGQTPDVTRVRVREGKRWRWVPRVLQPVEAQPGESSFVTFYVANLGDLTGEPAGGFRVYLKDAAGRQFRMPVKSIEETKEPGVYAVTARLFDENGFNGQPTLRGDYLVRLTWRGMASNQLRFALWERGGSLKDDEPVVPPPTQLPLEPGKSSALNDAPTAGVARMASGGDRYRFMQQSTFGATTATDLRLRQLGMNRWLNEQFNKPYPSIAYPNLPLQPTTVPATCTGSCSRDNYTMYPLQNWFYKEALYGDDQLRRRVSWALSQIWVVSGNDTQQPSWLLQYIKVLDKHALGNYRDLMQEMTLNPAMGNYLDMVRSTKNSPNENYPREILQLFTLGTDLLNQDGTPVLDNNGNRIPTYDQAKVDNFTKVFTGWTVCNTGCPNSQGNATPNYIDPMVLNPNNHNVTAKTLFNYPGAPNPTIAACQNCNTAAIRTYGTESLNQALDNIFNHPNMGPFVGTHLIQHLVTSDPSPAYVGRVAAVFNNNGAGVRGDMQAVVRAVLLDPEARGSRKTDPNYGKLREPVQFVTNILRGFGVRASGTIRVNNQDVAPPAECGGQSDGYINPQTAALSQSVWYSPSVFNYYSPSYVVPGTDVVGPEFNILNTSTSFNRVNFANTVVFGQIAFQQATTTNTSPNTPCGTSIDLAEMRAIAGQDTTGNALIETLNTRLLNGAMSDAMKSRLRTAIQAVPAANVTLRAQTAVYLVASSSQFQVQR